MTEADARRLSGWTPIRMSWGPTAPVVDWCFTEGVDFTDPFFDQTVARCLHEPFRLLFRRQTPMATLAKLAELRPGLTPSGMVFHTSRCGSTLVSQMLARLPSVLVMAEPGPLETVLSARCVGPGGPEGQREDWLRWMVSALGQPGRPGQQHFVIKFDAWAVLHLPLIRRAFPNTPSVFVYRDPADVLASHLRHRGYHMVPGCLPPGLLGMEADEIPSLSPEAYMAAVLARLFEAVLSLPEPDRPLPINYRRLPHAVTESIAPMFGIGLGPGDAAALRDVAARDAKNPSLAWAADTGGNRRPERDRLLAQVERLVQPLYEAMEAGRPVLR